MNSRRMGLLVAAFVFLAATVTTGFNATDRSDILIDDAKMKVVYDRGADKWFVVTSKGKKEPAKGKKKYDVEWKAVGSEMIFTFPEEIREHLERKTGSYNPANGIAIVKKGKKFKIRIKESAPVGSFEYEVYVKKDDTYAEGTSPPVIIIGN